jgi:hypothetical protein
MPVYTLRVVPLPAGQGGWQTHQLRMELRGAAAWAGLPLHQLGPDSYKLDSHGEMLDLTGTVTRSGSQLHIAVGPGRVLEASTSPVAITMFNVSGQ